MIEHYSEDLITKLASNEPSVKEISIQKDDIADAQKRAEFFSALEATSNLTYIRFDNLDFSDQEASSIARAIKNNKNLRNFGTFWSMLSLSAFELICNGIIQSTSLKECRIHFCNVIGPDAVNTIANMLEYNKSLSILQVISQPGDGHYSYKDSIRSRLKNIAKALETNQSLTKFYLSEKIDRDSIPDETKDLQDIYDSLKKNLSLSEIKIFPDDNSKIEFMLQEHLGHNEKLMPVRGCHNDLLLTLMCLWRFSKHFVHELPIEVLEHIISIAHHTTPVMAVSYEPWALPNYYLPVIKKELGTVEDKSYNLFIANGLYPISPNVYRPELEEFLAAYNNKVKPQSIECRWGIKNCTASITDEIKLADSVLSQLQRWLRRICDPEYMSSHVISHELTENIITCIQFLRRHYDSINEQSFNELIRNKKSKYFYKLDSKELLPKLQLKVELGEFVQRLIENKVICANNPESSLDFHGGAEYSVV